MGLRSYPSGSFLPETPSTSFSFIRSDRPVYATSSIRSTGLCQPSTAGPTFSYLRNPYPHIPGGIHNFYGRFHSGVGRSHGRALRYYHRYLTEHPELRKDRRHLFVPIKDNNAGKELSASTISRWICTTIVDSHAAIQNSRNLSGSVKAHEVRAVATSLQLFNKVALHSVMKAGRWSSGVTFTSFYLRDLCPQADSLQRAGHIVAAGDIIRISSS